MAATVGFLALGVAARNGWVKSWDNDVLTWVRPGDVWGPWQIRADVIVEGLRPTVVGALLAVLMLVVCGWRRSLRPAVLSGLIGAVTIALTLGSKLAVGRPDPHGSIENHGGSFPSGHTVSLAVCLGLAVILVGAARRPAAWLLPGVAACVMAGALVVQGAHWATDVLGGALLAVAVLAGANAIGAAEVTALTGEGRRIAKPPQ